MFQLHRRPQICILGSADPGSAAYQLAGQAGALLAQFGITVVSGCGSPATRMAAEQAVNAGGLVVSIIPSDEMPSPDWPAKVVIPCGMGDARNLLMALAGDACVVIGGRAGTISEVCLAWLHNRPLLPLVGCGGWSDSLPSNPPDERQNFSTNWSGRQSGSSITGYRNGGPACIRCNCAPSILGITPRCRLMSDQLRQKHNASADDQQQVHRTQ